MSRAVRALACSHASLPPALPPALRVPPAQALWVYGAMVFNCMPNSSTLRASLACFCWALLGYIGHEVVAHSVRGQQGVAARLLTS